MSRIFIGTNPNTTTVADFIEFDETPVVANSSYSIETSFRTDKIDTSVNDPNPQNLGQFQNTGSAITEVTITGKIPFENAQNRRNIRNFGLVDDVTTALPFGIFGFVLDNYPEFNLIPSTNRGSRVQSIQLARPTDEPTRIGFVAVMRIFGDKGTRSNNFSWT